MFKKTYVIAVGLCLCLIVPVSAQFVAGRVTDTLNNAVQYSAIALLQASDSSIYRGVITSDSGQFFFNKPAPGNYLIKIKLPEYKLFYSDVIVVDSNTNITLPPFILSSSGVNLGEVSVSALKKTVEFKNGNIVVNIENSALASGNTVYDLLSHLPGVALDPINNNISIQGREGIRVLMDGRMQQLSGRQLINLLKSISASSVEKIEVLKNPPIEYAAEGTGGMINIKTKKVKINGFSGNITTTASQGFYARGESGFSLNYKTDKITFFSNVYSEYGQYISVNKFNRVIDYNGTETHLNQQHTEIEYDKGFEANAGIDWHVNKKNILGVKLTTGPGKETSAMRGATLLSDNTTGYDRLDYDIAIHNVWNYSNYNINAEHVLDTSGSKLKFSADYSPNRETYQGNFSNVFSNAGLQTPSPRIIRSATQDHIDIFSTKLDAEKKLAREFELQTGLRFSQLQAGRAYDVKNQTVLTGEYVNDTAISNTLRYREKITAGYIQIKKELNDFEFEAGVRGEYTDIKGESIGRNFSLRRNYFNLFPLVSIEYEPGDKHNFQLSFNQRINRPESYSYIPYKNYQSNILITDRGNPNLKPEYSNTIEFTHTYAGSISNAIAYSRLSNYLMEYTLQNDSSKETTSYIANIKSSTTLGYNLFFDVPLKKWWNASGNIMATYNFYSGQVNGVDYRASGFGYQGVVTNVFLLKKDMKLEVEAQYVGLQPLGIFTIQPRWSLNLALKKSFFKNKVDAAIGLNDIFYTFIGKNKVNYQNQKWTISETNDTRRIKLSFTWNFGKLKVEERETSSNEEAREKLKH